VEDEHFPEETIAILGKRHDFVEKIHSVEETE
jgi:hypothetical protein